MTVMFLLNVLMRVTTGKTLIHVRIDLEERGWAHSDQARLNQIQEAERHREFLARESQFVYRQRRKAAEIRVKEGRARPIDWLTVNLRIIDPIEDLINDDSYETEFDYNDPETVFESLSAKELADIQREISDFLALEENPSNRSYWKSIQIICRHRQQGADGRAVQPVSADIETLLAPKTYEELEKLQKQITKKLESDGPIDTDYWQQLLDSLLVYKAKAKLNKISTSVIQRKLARLQAENVQLAMQAKKALSTAERPPLSYHKSLDPDPRLSLATKDKSLQILDESQFLQNVAAARRTIEKIGFVPLLKDVEIARPACYSISNQDSENSALAMFKQEVAKGFEDDEEVFTGEELVPTKPAPESLGKFKLRKPRYFNRVQMGYEWNKYNQTHYDHDNPPPKVVQGYKFHIFYPDLIDPSKAPTYRIIREGGRKRGETAAPAGEEDTCIIRFISGPPYEDIAFRIVDRDWDYSAKNDRGFKSTFERGILTLHFSFKKVYYRK